MNWHLVPNLYFDLKYEREVFKKLQIEPFLTSPLLEISNFKAKKACEILKTAKIVSCKESEQSDEVKIAFSDTPSHNILR